MRLWLLLSMILAVLLPLLVPAEAEAVRFGRPFEGTFNMGSGFDNNGRAGTCTDYNCGGRCYDGHTGTDYPMPLGTRIVSPANGTVTGVVFAGCADYGSLGNTCGGRCGNHVALRWDDGTTSVLCHMRSGTIPVSSGQRVSCGQYLGQSASSGSSTGPHLHFGWRRSSGSTDVYAGSCTGSPGAWVDQGAYWGHPGTGCESSCECSPGQTQREGCGRCGSRGRTCGGDCRWGGWSGCEGEGPCWPGTREERPCCDCGTEARTCNGACNWDAFGACQGPDPDGGNRVCETGEDGVCNDGRVRCVNGCTACRRLIEPSPEVCDDLDNDCNAETDEGYPQTLASIPPAFAAVRVDYSAPGLLERGERAGIWMQYRNVGTQAWPAGEIWLTSRTARDGTPSPLYDAASWHAYDVAAVLDETVAPGQIATIAFEVVAGESLSTGEWFESFDLVDPYNNDMRCPSPGIDLDVLIEPAATSDATPAPRVDPTPLPSEDAGTAAPDAGGADVDGVDVAPQPDAALPDSERSPNGDEPADESGASYSSTSSCSAAGAAPIWSFLFALFLARRRATSDLRRYRAR